MFDSPKPAFILSDETRIRPFEKHIFKRLKELYFKVFSLIKGQTYA